MKLRGREDENWRDERGTRRDGDGDGSDEDDVENRDEPRRTFDDYEMFRHSGGCGKGNRRRKEEEEEKEG